MTTAELIEKLQQGIRNGSIEADDEVMVRNLSVSELAMEAGSQGYDELEEVLFVDGAAYLLIGAE